MKENAKRINNVTVSVDWLSFTVHDEDCTLESIIDILGFTREQFSNMPNGANGYKRMLKYENISILYDGADNMGVHVNITGSSIATVLEAHMESLATDTPFGVGYDIWGETVLSHLLRQICEVGKITRMDIAIDDYGCNYYSLEEIEDKIEQGRVCSKWRARRNLSESKVSNNQKVGHTMYFGSTQSEIMMRIYNKQLEQNKGKDINDENYIHDAWIRWELELHKDRANEVARLLLQQLSIGEIAIGVLSYYFRIITLDDSNKSRCSIEPKWAKFVENVNKLKITVKKEDRTLEEEIGVFERQYGRKVAKILFAKGGDKDYFGELGNRYKHKLTMHDKEQLANIGIDIEEEIQ